MNKCVAALLLFGLLIAACGPSSGSVVAERKEKGNEVLVKIDAYAGKVVAGEAGREPLKLPDGVKLVFARSGKEGNAKLVQAELVKPGVPPALDLGYVTNDFSLEREYLAGQKLDHPADKIAGALDEMINRHYMAFARTLNLKRPTPNLDGTFNHGTVVVEVFVLDLHTGKELGMLSVTGATGEEWVAKSDSYDDMQKALDEYLALDARVEIARAFKPFCEAEGEP